MYATYADKYRIEHKQQISEMVHNGIIYAKLLTCSLKKSLVSRKPAIYI